MCKADKPRVQKLLSGQGFFFKICCNLTLTQKLSSRSLHTFGKLSLKPTEPGGKKIYSQMDLKGLQWPSTLISKPGSRSLHIFYPKALFWVKNEPDLVKGKKLCSGQVTSDRHTGWHSDFYKALQSRALISNNLTFCEPSKFSTSYFNEQTLYQVTFQWPSITQ